MKIRILLGLVLIALCVICTGCLTEPAYQNPNTQEVITPAEKEALPPEAATLYQPVSVAVIDPAVATTVDAGLSTATVVATSLADIYPPAASVLAVLGILGTCWQNLKKRKVVVEKDEVITAFNKVKLGAQITAENIETTIKPIKEVWDDFKAKQSAASANTDATMPDKV